MCESDFSTDLDAPTIWDEKVVTARKPHRCAECRGRIDAGATYTRVGSLFEGAWETLRFCAPCAETAAAFDAEHHGHVVGDLGLALLECVRESVADKDLANAKRWGVPLRDMNRRRRAANRAKFEACGVSLGGRA